MTDGLKILVAEDDPTLKMLIEIFLRKIVVPFKVVSNGAEAVAAVEKEDFSMIFMDIQMPEMDGIEATKLIRDKEKGSGKHIPVIAMTGVDEAECRDMGVDACLTKPVSFARFSAAIEEYSGRH